MGLVRWMVRVRLDKVSGNAENEVSGREGEAKTASTGSDVLGGLDDFISGSSLNLDGRGDDRLNDIRGDGGSSLDDDDLGGRGGSRGSRLVGGADGDNVALISVDGERSANGREELWKLVWSVQDEASRTTKGKAYDQSRWNRDCGQQW